MFEVNDDKMKELREVIASHHITGYEAGINQAKYVDELHLSADYIKPPVLCFYANSSEIDQEELTDLCKEVCAPDWENVSSQISDQVEDLGIEAIQHILDYGYLHEFDTVEDMKQKVAKLLEGLRNLDTEVVERLKGE